MSTSKNDPLGLFPDKAAADQPAVVRDPVPQPKSSNDGMGWIVVGVLLGIALLAGWQRLGWDFSFGGDRDGGGDVRPVTDKTGYLIFVHERQTLSVDEANMLDVAAEVCAANPGLEFRSVDDDLTDPAVVKLIDFAKSKGVSPPLVVHKAKSGNLLRAAAFPKSKAELEKVLK